jgi:hypothetical protein
MKPAAVASFQPKTVLFWEIFAIEDTIVTCNLYLVTSEKQEPVEGQSIA